MCVRGVVILAANAQACSVYQQPSFGVEADLIDRPEQILIFLPSGRIDALQLLVDSVLKLPQPPGVL